MVKRLGDLNNKEDRILLCTKYVFFLLVIVDIVVFVLFIETTRVQYDGSGNGVFSSRVLLGFMEIIHWCFRPIWTSPRLLANGIFSRNMKQLDLLFFSVSVCMSERACPHHLT